MRLILAANWKMHLLPEEARQLAQEIVQGWPKFAPPLRGILFPPFLYLGAVEAQVRGTSLEVGAQNGYPGGFGPYTGEVSMQQIAAIGARWVLVGHSERRQHFGERGPLLRRKVMDAQQRGLSVLYCVGETAAERAAGQTFAVLARQIAEVLEDSSISWERLALAYEPVWAIGTGHNATAAQAQEAHAFLRNLLAQKGAPAHQIPILYGGSLKPENAPELFAQPDVDGGLVGGASLKAETFLPLAEILLRRKGLIA
ncbi:MAG: triose-phosphate isomerase [Bacteroidia bacterium]|nr:triose-phosphate isomerase [Bacteroidia bacterium]MDW8088607.1 triose-phosphate isomerase [Bacteroidia bacterium]